MPTDNNVDFKATVRANYDIRALEYQKLSRLQKGNLANLIDHAIRWKIHFPSGTILDAGCGIPRAWKDLNRYFPSQIKRYIGLDLSIEMLKLSSRTASVSAINGDLDSLPFKDGRFSLVISNSALHWLNIPECGQSPQNAFTELYRVLKHGGILLFSVAAVGSSATFLDAYQEVTQKVFRERAARSALLRKDPIGCMSLPQISVLLRNAGFTLLRAEQHYEPVRYPSASFYAQHVKAYGYEMFMAPFQRQHRDATWKSIIRAFSNRTGRGPYTHDQYMIYAAGMKPRSRLII